MAPAFRPLVAASLVTMLACLAPGLARAQPLPPAPPADDEGPLRRRGAPPEFDAPSRRPRPDDVSGQPRPADVSRPPGSGGAPDDEGPLRRRADDGLGPAPPRVSRLALWAGGRVGVALPVAEAFQDFDGNAFAERELVGPGPSLELDVGARIGGRFVPFVFGEFLFASSGSAAALPAPRPPPASPADGGAAPPGASSPGVDAGSAFAVGLGFRYEFDPEGLGPALEIAYAFRRTNVTFNTGQRLALEAPGEVRIGLGASWRVADALVLSPLATFAAGSYGDALLEGDDGRERAVAAESPLHGYLGLSVGAHVDLFGKR